MFSEAERDYLEERCEALRIESFNNSILRRVFSFLSTGQLRLFFWSAVDDRQTDEKAKSSTEDEERLGEELRALIRSLLSPVHPIASDGNCFFR
jgi:hypothetical protein